MNAELIRRIADLEWANYAATLPAAEVTPGLDVVLREDLILTRSEIFPSPDANHACLLRADPQAVEGVIDEAIDYFQSQDTPATIFISPACAPADLANRLSKRGFVRQKEQEAWMVLENLAAVTLPAMSPRVDVRSIAPDDALTMANVFMAAFDMPVEYAPYMAQLLAPSIGLPGIVHYLAFVGGQAVGTCSLMCHRNYGVLGSMGIVPSRRGKRIATSLAIKACLDAIDRGVDTLMLQTAADTMLERLLRINGFIRVFARTSYSLG
ncbi:MAG: GNAT family N-acetyltransferase [Anaerolineae bacterium]|nr:GNAT family N-acetyltransferase [Anaerolineae bacterium]